MFSVNLSTHEDDGGTVVALRGELDVIDAASVAAELAALMAGGNVVVADLSGLEFITSSGWAALKHVRKRAHLDGGDLLLAPPQRQALRVLVAPRLIDVLSVHACVNDADGTTERSPAAARPAPLPAA